MTSFSNLVVARSTTLFVFFDNAFLITCPTPEKVHIICTSAPKIAINQMTAPTHITIALFPWDTTSMSYSRFSYKSFFAAKRNVRPRYTPVKICRIVSERRADAPKEKYMLFSFSTKTNKAANQEIRGRVHHNSISSPMGVAEYP